HRPMAGTDKQTEDKEAKPSRLDEAKGVIERYLNDLREIIRKLRQKMN
ncbi:signal transduction histidine kinase, partial [Bradyrhizobium sp. SBR1B]|nr:signal transduction histidine kinase [Bradyrhizobium sp. SBR1B]